MPFMPGICTSLTTTSQGHSWPSRLWRSAASVASTAEGKLSIRRVSSDMPKSISRLSR